MRIGHYVLSLCCDRESCSQWDFRYKSEVTATDREDAEQKAEIAGWHLGDEDLCPQCAREKK